MKRYYFKLLECIYFRLGAYLGRRWMTAQIKYIPIESKKEHTSHISAWYDEKETE